MGKSQFAETYQMKCSNDGKDYAVKISISMNFLDIVMLQSQYSTIAQVQRHITNVIPIIKCYCWCNTANEMKVPQYTLIGVQEITQGINLNQEIQEKKKLSGYTIQELVDRFGQLFDIFIKLFKENIIYYEVQAQFFKITDQQVKITSGFFQRARIQNVINQEEDEDMYAQYSILRRDQFQLGLLFLQMSTCCDEQVLQAIRDNFQQPQQKQIKEIQQMISMVQSKYNQKISQIISNLIGIDFQKFIPYEENIQILKSVKY